MFMCKPHRRWIGNKQWHNWINWQPSNKLRYCNSEQRKKGTLITKSFTLPRRVRPVRSFKCGVENCNQVFGVVKDLNQHHWDNYPPVKCDMCTKYFSCPNEMLKHKYKHYEIMFECAVCEQGFTFESQYKDLNDARNKRDTWTTKSANNWQNSELYQAILYVFK